ncbi:MULTISPECIES: SDR family oxidoreductase [unclassified Flavobacterium]|uniref:SDR family oxidoreductase n=1 Tax=unclassified Flavobacterium TaxID=196869 RepID=UPI001F140785|nr:MULTISPECIES: SDR family oxidoreductase [unclassified Flavobacterium]UMY65423.1 SDR family oxidoreductase [Flavobacterium sp. HJ-32-4]
MKLTQQKIVVIGGSSGIGKSVAALAFESGNEVILTSRDAQKAERVAQEIGPGVRGWALDVDSEADVNAFFQQLEAIDHVYVAAGTTGLGALTEGALDDHLLRFHTRFTGSLRVVRAALAKMNPGGSFVFTGGISTDRPIAGAWVSGLGTASAEQLAKVLVPEFPHLRFNAISPGYTDTPLWDAVLGDNKTAVLTEVASKIPTGKIATAEEVASAVVFLMSNPSVNGEVVHIDGGARFV